MSIAGINGFQTRVFASGRGKLSQPDDVTAMNGDIYVGYQNGVGETGKSATKDGTVVEYSSSGTKIASWNIAGHIDGLTADTAKNTIIATVNENGPSSMHVITPGSPTVQSISFSPNPLTVKTGPLAVGGGTDAITLQNGHMYISASSPVPNKSGQFTHAAVVQATLNGNKAVLSPLFLANAPATNEATGKPMTMNISDPDSNAAVPADSALFANDFMLLSQNDQDLIFDKNPGTTSQKFTLLPLSDQIDDVRWATSATGTLYVADTGANKVYAITGHFTPGAAYVSATSYIGTLNLSDGQVSPVVIGMASPAGMWFVPSK